MKKEVVQPTGAKIKYSVGMNPGSRNGYKNGHSPSREFREYMRVVSRGNHSHFGIKHTEEAKIRMSLNRKGKGMGERNGAWKGGITSFELAERARFRRDMQKMVFERDNYICQLCGQKSRVLQIDHIQRWADFVGLRFLMDNCRTVCVPCHYKITFGRPMPVTTKNWGQAHAKAMIGDIK